LHNDGFGGPDDVSITNWDSDGNFAFTVQTPLLPGVHRINVQGVDKAGNKTPVQPVDFILQAPSTVNWAAQGPGPIDTTGVVNYNSVSGHITAVQVDPRDLTGNTIYVGTDNGGVWKTTDGGNDWKALTDNV